MQNRKTYQKHANFQRISIRINMQVATYKTQLFPAPGPLGASKTRFYEGFKFPLFPNIFKFGAIFSSPTLRLFILLSYFVGSQRALRGLWVRQPLRANISSGGV